ncbi:hypothetical protein ACFORL_04690 [Legionella dresdenensis]|uniref:Uncharacterized protein n=1 Tax=Legionella dresdenensis TaxID=450200 RepID=A0ABV8CDY4_9GAMM
MMGIGSRLKSWFIGSKTNNTAQGGNSKNGNKTTGNKTTPAVEEESSPGFILNMLSAGKSLAAAVPATAMSVYAHQPTRELAGTVVKILREDFALPLLISFVNDTLEKVAQSQDDEQDNNTNPFVKGALGVLTLVELYYWITKGSRGTVRLFAVGATARSSLNLPKEINNNEIGIRTGSRELAVVVGTKLSLWGLSFKAPLSAKVLSHITSSRYALSSRIPVHDATARMDYLQQNFEYVFCLAITEALASLLITYAIDSDPNMMLEFLVEQIVMLVMLNLVAHMTVPNANTVKRWIPDPVAYYQSSLAFAFDLTVFVIQKAMPFIMNQPPSHFPWDKVKAFAVQTVAKFKTLRQTPFVQEWIAPTAVKVVPDIFQSELQFRLDPVLSQYLGRLRVSTIELIKSIEEMRETPKVRLVLSLPTRFGAFITASFAHIHSNVAKTALKFFANPEMMRILGDIRRVLEITHTTRAPAVETESSTIAMGESQETPSQPVENPVRHTSQEVSELLKASAAQPVTSTEDKPAPRSSLQDMAQRLAKSKKIDKKQQVDIRLSTVTATPLVVTAAGAAQRSTQKPPSKTPVITPSSQLF